MKLAKDVLIVNEFAMPSGVKTFPSRGPGRRWAGLGLSAW